MRLLVIAALALCGLYLAAAGTMFALQRQMQYFPGQRGPLPSEAGFDGATEYALAAADLTRVLLWYSPAPPGAPTVLYLQGNGGEIADRPRRWQAYRDAGLGVAFLSYRGYGGSDGAPTEAGLHMDADAAYDWLLAQGVAADRIAVVGESLGTGVAVRLAAEREVGALLLEAPFTSAADVAAGVYRWLPVRWLMLDQYPSADRIGRVAAPILIIHGEADRTIPLALGKALFDAAPEPKEFHAVAGAGHDSLFVPATWAIETDFIAHVLPGP